MAVIMTRFCFCEGANLRLGGIVVGILSVIGSFIMLGLTLLSMVSTLSTEREIHNPNSTKHFSNKTIEHVEGTLYLEYWSLSMDIISIFVAALLIYGVIKCIRPILYIYIVWTIIIVLTTFGGLVWLALDGAHLIIAIFVFQFFLLLVAAIYFILVVYSYSELIRQGGERQATELQGPVKDAKGQSDSKLPYSQFENQRGGTGIGGDGGVTTA